MLTEKQLKIFSVFVQNIFGEYTFKDIKEKSGEKSNNALQLAIKKFKSENLVKERKLGASSLLSINTEEPVVFDYLSIYNTANLPKNVKSSLKHLQIEIERHTPFYCIALFGSYTKKTQKKDSDLDIAVFIESEKNKDCINAAANMAKDKSLLPLDVHIITKSEFLEMLLHPSENLGKQIARNHIACHNPKTFYSLLKEGMKHGFNI